MKALIMYSVEADSISVLSKLDETRRIEWETMNENAEKNDEIEVISEFYITEW